MLLNNLFHCGFFYHYYSYYISLCGSRWDILQCAGFPKVELLVNPEGGVGV